MFESQNALELAAAILLVESQRSMRMHQFYWRMLTDQHIQPSELVKRTPADLLMILTANQSIEGLDLAGKRSPAQPNQLTNFCDMITSPQNWAKALEQAKRYSEFEIVPILSGHPHYPTLLKRIDSAPGILFLRGRKIRQALEIPLWITVVGTRNPTLYGQLVTEQITGDLAAQGTLIVSGLARGIDTIAHEIALEKNALTLAVVSSGLDQVYPPENKYLMETIADQGVIVSEHPPGVKPLRQYFPARNRILSGLSNAVAVMEASHKSGTLITAGFAADQGRDVFAVPGNILDQASAGCHHLIRDGARILESADDIFETFPIECAQMHLQPQQGNAILNYPNRMLMTPSQQNILSSLRGHSLTLEYLSERLSLSISEISRLLSFLEINGLIAENRGRYALTALGHCSI